MKIDSFDRVSFLIAARGAALRSIAAAREPFRIQLEIQGARGAITAPLVAGGGTTNPGGLKTPVVQAILALMAAHFEADLAVVETELRSLGVEP